MSNSRGQGSVRGGRNSLLHTSSRFWIWNPQRAEWDWRSNLFTVQGKGASLGHGGSLERRGWKEPVSPRFLQWLCIAGFPAQAVPALKARLTVSKVCICRMGFVSLELKLSPSLMTNSLFPKKLMGSYLFPSGSSTSGSIQSRTG